jgi:electron transfer flavoprotein alpha subunit
MRALIFGGKPSDLMSCYGFLKILGEYVDTDIEVYGSIAAENSIDKSQFQGLVKLYLLEKGSNDAYSKALINIAEEINPDIFLALSEKDGIEVVSRVASKYMLPMITEVVGIEKIGEELVVSRPVIGGRALAIYRFTTPIALTVSPGKFKPAEGDITPESVDVALPESNVKVIETLPKERGAVDIETVDVVVGVGRGFNSKEDLSLAFELSKLLDGEVGCSRPIAADFQWLDENRWIGISGKKIRGKLYFAIGISGAPQHIMAASDVKVIVAVNKDKSAPIFNYSDYGIVADLYQFLPVFIEKLRERLG